MDDSSDDDRKLKGEDDLALYAGDKVDKNVVGKYVDKRTAQESVKKDDYKHLYNVEAQKNTDLKHSLETLEKRYKKLSTLHQKCDVVELLDEIQKRGGVYKEGDIKVAEATLKKLTEKGEVVRPSPPPVDPIAEAFR